MKRVQSNQELRPGVDVCGVSGPVSSAASPGVDAGVLEGGWAWMHAEAVGLEAGNDVGRACGQGGLHACAGRVPI